MNENIDDTKGLMDRGLLSFRNGVMLALVVLGLVAQSALAAERESRSAVSSKGRIYVAVQTAPGSSLEGEVDPYRGTAILAVDPDTGTEKRITDKATLPRVSLDAQTMVYLTAEGICAHTGDGPARLVRSVNPQRTEPILSADGKEIIYSVRRPSSEQNQRSFDSWRCRIAGSEPTKLSIPDADGVMDWSSDGQWLLTLRASSAAGGGLQLYIMRPNGKEQQHLGDGAGVYSFPRFSPDGKRIVYLHQKDGAKNSLWVMDRDGQHAVKLVDYSDIWHPEACWSPDGKRLAVVDYELGAGRRLSDARYRLDVMNADGTDRRTLLRPNALWMSAPDWR
jgi:hypothetical protein